MAIRYTRDDLMHLKDSPLVVKPPGLPPAEQWMGPPADSTHQSSRRPVAERHVSRNSANPEEIVLGPPKTAFMSATSIRNAGKTFDSSDRPPLRDVDTRFNYRGGRTGDGDNNDRTRDSRNTLRVKRGEGDQDSDGWSTVKPRKSFGNEGAERFNGRMGLDRHKDDRRFKEREERDVKDRPQRGFESFSRDKDVDHDQERERDTRKNGTGRGRNEPSWFKDNTDASPLPKERHINGDRLPDRSRGGWRDKDRDDRGDRGDRGERTERGERSDRRWDRDREQRQEREPEWMAEPEEEKSQAHTQEDFQKWKEQMQGKEKPAASKASFEEPLVNPNAGNSFFGLEKQKVETPLAIETGPDKFFGKWAGATASQETTPDSGVEPKKEGVAKAKTAGKASRFTSFFAPQEEPVRSQTQPPPAMPSQPPSGLESLFQNNSNAPNQEKEAFAALLRKLHQGTGSTPPANAAMQPKPPAPEKQQSNPISSPEPFQQYRTERPEEQRPSARNSQQALQDMLNQRQLSGSQPAVRPEQMLQELVGQRQNALSQSSSRPDLPSRNSNTDFLMGLMQSAKAAPEPQRSESLLLRMPPQQQKPMDRQMDRQLQQQLIEQEMQREAAQRERSASQRQGRPPPGFYDDPAVFQRGPPPQHERQAGNPPQPTQILQRPAPPPGLELGWDRAAQLPPPQHRINQNIPPPPGLAGGPNRAMPPQQQMFPPAFTMGNFPPDMIPPPRNLPMQPPPGFYNGGPPPGFLPPGISGFQGPEGMAFGGPFDGRGPPPQNAFRRQ